MKGVSGWLNKCKKKRKKGTHTSLLAFRKNHRRTINFLSGEISGFNYLRNNRRGLLAIRGLETIIASGIVGGDRREPITRNGVPETKICKFEADFFFLQVPSNHEIRSR